MDDVFRLAIRPEIIAFNLYTLIFVLHIKQAKNNIATMWGTVECCVCMHSIY